MRKERIEITEKEKVTIESLLQENFDKIKIRPLFKRELLKKLEKNFQKKERKEEVSHKERSSISIFDFLFGTRLARAAVAVFTVFCLLGSTTMYAYNSPEVTRGDSLYVLKRMAESVEISAVFSDTKKAFTYIRFAERRRLEVEVLIKRGALDTKTIEEVTENTSKAIEAAKNIQDKDALELLKKEAAEASRKQKDTLEKVIIESIQGNLLIKDEDGQEQSTENLKKVIEENASQIEQGIDTMKFIDGKTNNNDTSNSVEDSTSINKSNEENCSNECEKVGEKICVGKKIKKCLQEKGCLVLKDEKECGAEEVCENASCREKGQMECSFVDEKRCQGQKIETCGFWGKNFLSWKETSDCNASEGEKCSQGKCIKTCQDECRLGAKKCLGNSVLQCAKKNGCLKWATTNTCISGTACRSGVCTKTCTNECRLNQKICDGNKVRTCSKKGACYLWGEVIQECQADEKCENGSCVKNCKNECEIIGKTKCVGTDVYSCGFWGGNCLKWKSEITCNTNQKCHEGKCVENQGACKLGDSRCEEGNLQKCGFWGKNFIWWKTIDENSAECKSS